MSEFKEGEVYEAACLAWEAWHDSIGAIPDPDDDYVPMVSIQWIKAFRAGVEWVQKRGEE